MSILEERFFIKNQQQYSLFSLIYRFIKIMFLLVIGLIICAQNIIQLFIGKNNIKTRPK